VRELTGARHLLGVNLRSLHEAWAGAQPFSSLPGPFGVSQVYDVRRNFGARDLTRARRR
jgi:hypothetical protein